MSDWGRRTIDCQKYKSSNAGRCFINWFFFVSDWTDAPQQRLYWCHLSNQVLGQKQTPRVKCKPINNADTRLMVSLQDSFNIIIYNKQYLAWAGVLCLFICVLKVFVSQKKNHHYWCWCGCCSIRGSCQLFINCRMAVGVLPYFSTTKWFAIFNKPICAATIIVCSAHVPWITIWRLQPLFIFGHHSRCWLSLEERGNFYYSR